MAFQGSPSAGRVRTAATRLLYHLAAVLCVRAPLGRALRHPGPARHTAGGGHGGSRPTEPRPRSAHAHPPGPGKSLHTASQHGKGPPHQRPPNIGGKRLHTASQHGKGPPHHRPPNIVLLFVDDLGYGDVGFNGHPTSHTPNIDRLAFGGKVLTTWYSGCSICTGARAAFLTGRQFPRTGLPDGIGPLSPMGLPLNETTLAEQLKEAHYRTAIVGKWHLGQRHVYLPGNRGFDYYLGVPYSSDMGFARLRSCTNGSSRKGANLQRMEDADVERLIKAAYSFEGASPEAADARDAAALWLPLVYQEFGRTQVLQQPVDLTSLAERYNDFAVDFVKSSGDRPFLLYLPFSHVHVTMPNTYDSQYAGCRFQGKTRRGPFGDGLAEVDWIVGNVHQAIKDAGLEEDTLILFTGDNGPHLEYGVGSGSVGLLTGSHAGYHNVGKGSTWEGGIREAAFAYWKGRIQPHSRSAEVVSSLDVFPTVSALANVPLPKGRIFDGRDMRDVLFQADGKSLHDFLFFYGRCAEGGGPAAVRHGHWKAHFCTGPGLGPCKHENCKVKHYEVPLLFDVEADPSEAIPVDPDGDPEAQAALERIRRAYSTERATFVYGTLVPEPDEPGELYGVCCDRRTQCNCKDPALGGAVGIFGMGSSEHHAAFHQHYGQDAPLPPTLAQDQFASAALAAAA